ncbi:unnamed protein product, partial [Rotaria sp. Silwood1]
MYGPSIILSVVYLAGRTHIGLLGVVTGFHRQLISCKATSSVNIFCIFIQLLLSCSTLELKSNKCYAFSTNFNERVDRILVDADFS